MAKLVHDSGNAVMVSFGETGSDGGFESGDIVC
jgi:hypothetical protein